MVHAEFLDIRNNTFSGVLPPIMGMLTRLGKYSYILSVEVQQQVLARFVGIHVFLTSCLSYYSITYIDTTLITNSGLTGPIPETFCGRDISDTIIEANCGNKNETELDDVIIPLCDCCNRENRSLIWCWEDGLDKFLEDLNN